jgi:4-hydroxy-tetrahydrodipicolinate synthase
MDSKPNSHAVRGLWCAMLTPIGRDGGVDHARFAKHAHALFAQGVDGVAPFGTTGEGQSFSMAERAAGLAALLKAGIPANASWRARAAPRCPRRSPARARACRRDAPVCLVLPPFFFKGMSDDGLFSWYSRLIEAVADSALRVFLYHIPQMSGVPLSVDLVARLAAAFPGIIAGVKDSAGDWSNTSALLARVPDLAILVGHEPHLPRLLKARGAARSAASRTSTRMVKALLSPSVSAEDEQRVATFIEIPVQVPLPAGVQGDRRRANRRSDLARGSTSVRRPAGGVPQGAARGVVPCRIFHRSGAGRTR